MTGVEHSASEKVPPAPPKSAETTYIVLAWENEDAPTGIAPPSLWRKVAEVAARSAEHAEKQYAEQSGSEKVLVLVAIPSRSWSPVKITPKTVTTLLIEDAS